MSDPKPVLCAVCYLNTAPLVWGVTHGPQRGYFDVIFRVPSVCAAMLASGEADIGLVPAIELARQKLTMVHGVGIASRQDVRSVLLCSKVVPGKIRTLAADASSRTSVVLAQVILARKYGVEPVLIPRAPDIESMLDAADAAVIIGDPAIRVDPGTAAFSVLDLGREWHDLTGLPMVYAVWAGRAEAVNERSGKILRESCRFGIDHLDQVIRTEAARRGFTEQFTRTYLTRNLVNEFGIAEYEGLNLFLEWGGKITMAATASSQELPPCAAISMV